MQSAIAIAELFCIGRAHVPYNAGLLEIVWNRYPDQRLIFFAEPEHMDLVRQQVSESVREHIEFVAIPVPRETHRTEILFLQQMWTLLRLQHALRQRGVSRKAMLGLLLSRVDGSQIRAWRMIRYCFGRDVPCFGVLHGELTGVLRDPAEVSPWRRMYLPQRAFASETFPKAGKELYIVLERAILAELPRYFPKGTDRFVCVPHPAARQKNDAVSGSADSRGLRLGFLGVATMAKGFDTFVDAARRHTGNASFVAIGAANKSTSHVDTSVLDLPPSETRMLRETFDTEVRRLDYMVAPFSGDYYRLAASGTLMDAIIFGKPVIAMRTPVLDELESAYGKFGYLFDSEDELIDCLVNIDNLHNPKAYAEMGETLERISKDRQPAALSSVFPAF